MNNKLHNKLQAEIGLYQYLIGIAIKSLHNKMHNGCTTNAQQMHTNNNVKKVKNVRSNIYDFFDEKKLNSLYDN